MSGEHIMCSIVVYVPEHKFEKNADRKSATR